MLELEKVEELTELYRKHISGELSDTEKILLDEMLIGLPDVKRIFEEASNEETFFNMVFTYYKQTEEITGEEVQKQFEKSLGEPKVVDITKKKTWYKWAAAASVIILLGLGAAYFTFFNGKSQDDQVVDSLKDISNDVAPGSYKAKLTLSDGSVVILDSAVGELTKQGNVLVKNETGQLIYDAQGKNTEVLYNILSTSIGESYSTTLSDGSKIWLNSGSNVKFPVAFTGDERVITASGEIYLEVAKDAKRSFKVEVLKEDGKKCEVEVLGTHFNIMAYPDEPQIQTTLLEGKIAIANTNRKKILTPGQQAALNEEGSIQVLNGVDIEMITAWKNQDFYFKSNDLKTIMRTLARWYGVEAVFEGAAVSDRRFSGMLSRNKNLSEVLQMIEQSGIRFKIEGKKVIFKSE